MHWADKMTGWGEPEAKFLTWLCHYEQVTVGFEAGFPSCLKQGSAEWSLSLSAPGISALTVTAAVH